ncbi:unnamed protein product, partial [Ectocarpus sp. 12 AP-2014]
MSQQPQQQLAGAVVVLALSIVTLAAVLAGMERGRSRRHARGCNHSPHAAVTRGEGANTESFPAAPALGSTAEGNRKVVGVVEASAPPGGGAAAGGRTSSVAEGSAGRRLEILVHNISHKDMVLSLRRTRKAAAAMPGQPPSGEEAMSNVIDAADTALARPKFSLFKRSSELILHKLQEIRAAGGSEPPPAVCPVYRRGESDLRSGPSSAPRESVSVGFDLDDTPIPIFDLAGYRVRSEDLDRLAPAAGRRSSSNLLRKVLNRRDSSGLFLAGSGGAGAGGSGGGGGTGRSHPVQDPGRRQLLLQQKQPQLQQLKEDGSGDGGCGGGGGGKGEGEAFISGVYFPLLSVLMPKWMELLAGSGDDVDSSKTVLLVSGVGQPRNEEHRLEDNSTEVTAVLMEAFLKRHFPSVRVVRVHSDTNIFRYDDNIRFVKTELLPLLNAERSQMAEKYGEDWQDMMHITMSFADGSPARISSINAALRHFKPSFIHIWELKTFWHEKAICEDDVEVHTFEDIDMQPPMPVSEVDAPTALIIAEMQRLRDDLERVLAAPPRGAVVGGDARDDLATFWLRKTKKPVLAVLLVQKKGGQPQLFRGTNMEVSMPTGSLCAERNVIGSALTSDLSLLRRDIKAVAVLSVAHLGGSTASTATAAAAVAIDGRKEGDSLPGIKAVDSGGGQSGRLGAAGLGLAVGSSVTTSCAPSPLSLTPAMKVSPKTALLRTETGGGAQDKERLEGVRQ